MSPSNSIRRWPRGPLSTEELRTSRELKEEELYTKRLSRRLLELLAEHPDISPEASSRIVRFLRSHY